MSEHNTRYFFDYFRRRLETIRGMEDPSDPQRGMTPDQSVLLATSVDALAKFWAELYSPALNAPGRARRRMYEFLIVHGRRDIFEQVSGPDLRRRALKKGQMGWIHVFRKLYADDDFDTLVRRWARDLPLAALVRDAGVAGSGMTEEWIRQSTYGEMLYTQFRCAWVHELAAGEIESRPFLWPGCEGIDEPHYANSIRGPFHVNRYLVFPKQLLLTTLSVGIERFERSCLRDGKIPAS